MVSFYYASVRETEADDNGPGGFDDASSGVGGSGVDDAGGLIFRYSFGSVLSTLRKLGGGLNPVRQQFSTDSCNKSSVAGQYDFREIISGTMMKGVFLPENWFACLRRHLVSKRDWLSFFFFRDK